MKTFKTPAGTVLPLMNIKGKDYLQVAHRIVWFRETFPEWGIETHLVQLGQDHCLAQATIRDQAGKVVATAHKFEDRKGFPDFIEKAETGALGRALALCGFGTQFCADELEEGKRLADSPIPRPGHVAPEQPGEDDGNTQSNVYKIHFGKFAGRTLDQVYREHGGKTILDYINYIENSAKKKGVALGDQAVEFIWVAEHYLGKLEQDFAQEKLGERK